LKRIAIEAIKQSLSPHLPKIGEPLTFEEAVRRARACDLTLVGHNQPDQPSLIAVISQQESVSRVGVWIGPEGGFTDDEIDHLVAAGGWLFSLGSRRLRAETAAIASISVLVSVLSGIPSHDDHD